MEEEILYPAKPPLKSLPRRVDGRRRGGGVRGRGTKPRPLTRISRTMFMYPIGFFPYAFTVNGCSRMDRFVFGFEHKQTYRIGRSALIVWLLFYAVKNAG